MGLFSVWLELSLHYTPTAFLQQVELTEDKLTMLLCEKVSFEPEKEPYSATYFIQDFD